MMVSAVCGLSKDDHAMGHHQVAGNRLEIQPSIKQELQNDGERSSVVELRKPRKKLHGLSPRANYTDRATSACRRNDCQLLRIEGATWSA
jgi:hypothetical protein